MISTDTEDIVCNIDINKELLSPCTHEEADYRMILHVNDMVRNNMKNIIVKTVDSDVVIICCSYFHEIVGLQTLWIAFGKGKDLKYIPVHDIAKAFGAEKSKGLLFFHAFTGCDSNSSFYDQGKKKPWAVWKENSEFTTIFNQLSSTPEQITDDVLSVVEKFVVKIYCSQLTCTTVNSARLEMFKYLAKDFPQIPPTKDALLQHLKRGAFTAGHVWGQALVKEPQIPPPSEWGYKREGESSWMPLWTTRETISKSHLQICRCKKQCKPPCLCATKKVICTSLCFCRGECFGNPRK